jgi:hypothetical protein
MVLWLDPSIIGGDGEEPGGQDHTNVLAPDQQTRSRGRG